MSVLIVEDERLVNWSLACNLTKWGFKIQTVFTGKDALDQIEKLEFDIILLDYQLPDLDGFEVARFVRRRQPDALIFLITAFQLNELPAPAGLIDNYFNKPLDFQQLHQALNENRRLHANNKEMDARSKYAKKSQSAFLTQLPQLKSQYKFF